MTEDQDNIDPNGIRHEPIANFEAGTPEEEELVGGELEDSVEAADSGENIIGISISRAQTHIADPKTPAAEKAAALKDSGGYFSDVSDWAEAPQDRTGAGNIISDHGLTPTPQLKAEVADLNTRDIEARNDAKEAQTPQELALPSPWAPAFSKTYRSDFTSGILGRGLGHRQRSWSASEHRLNLSFSLPSLPSLPNPTKLFSWPPKLQAQLDGTERQDSQHHDASLGFGYGSEVYHAQGGASSRTVLTAVGGERQSSIKEGNDLLHQVAGSPTLHQAQSNKLSTLRRTKSSLSTASSLGDDNRFSHVTKQVNNRAKALRDSFQDANLRLPSISTFPLMPKPSPKLHPLEAEPSEVSDAQRSHASKSLLRNSWGSGFGFSTSPSRMPRSRTSRHSPERRPAPVAGMTAANAAAHPHFAEALRSLTGDIVVLGGYRGSVLKEAKPPHRRLWIPFKASLNLQKVDLEVGLEVEDEETEHERVVATKMLSHIGPVDISRRLLKRLRACENFVSGKLRIHDYGYDWRLSPHRLSQQFIRFLEQLPCNMEGVEPKDTGALVIAHSLGGLITRHAVNKRPELFSGVLYAGVPQHCVNILGPMRNGDDVILSQKILTAQVNFTIRSSYALLPLSGRCFIDRNTREEYPVDFFDADQWVKYCWSPCVSSPLPTTTAPTKPLTSIIPSLSTIPIKLPDLPVLNRGYPRLREVNNPTSGYVASASAQESGMQPQMSSTAEPPTTASPKTTVTLPRSRAPVYLRRTLADCKSFLQELAYDPAAGGGNAYPPLAVVYGKSQPTVCGAKVDGRDGIARADAYDELAFASGDGVVLARAAQLPAGYRAASGGVVSSERGHVTLLSDLEAVGRCLAALMGERRAGVGLGTADGSAGGGKCSREEPEMAVI